MARSTRSVPPIVTTEWLDQHLGSPNLVVVDIRPRTEYAEGHIPGSVNIPFDPLYSAWTRVEDDFLLELPPPQELFRIASSAGISEDSTVVIVNKVDTVFSRADAARVAVELIYIGLDNVAILDGGYNKWVKEGRRVSRDALKPEPKPYRGTVRSNMFVSKQYVLERIGKAIIVDARDPEVYFGIEVEPWTSVPGHILTAKNLPAPWLWTRDGLYRPADVIKRMVEGVVGPDRDAEVIVYCGVGGYASALWYVMTQVLGYTRVRIYDRGWQEWVREPQGPISVYLWE